MLRTRRNLQTNPSFGPNALKTHRVCTQPVVVKTATSSAAAELLRKEAVIHFAVCNHPNILVCAGLLECPPHPALLLEQHRTTLACTLRTAMRLSSDTATAQMAQQRVRWLKEIANGVEHLHSHGVE